MESVLEKIGDSIVLRQLKVWVLHAISNLVSKCFQACVKIDDVKFKTK